jgi:intracellular multiplication protein IcmD
LRVLGVLVVFALLLESCTPATIIPSSEPTLPTLALTGTPSTVDAFSLGSVAGDGSTAIDPLFELPSIPTNQGTLGLTIWGAKDANGNITSVTEAEIAGLGSTGSSVHVFFNAANLPVLFVDDASGYSIAVTGERTSQPVITLCDPNGTADATTTLTTNGATVQTSAVTSGGSCATTAVVTTAASKRLAATAVETNLSSWGNFAKLINAASYVAGFGFGIGAILKFKEHKDNPTQIPIGTPIALIYIAAALLFLPTVLPTTGLTDFASPSLAPVDGLLPLYEPTP